jgi:hypothetical protein
VSDPAWTAVVWTLAIVGGGGLLGLAVVKWRRRRLQAEADALTYGWRKDHVSGTDGDRG